MAPFEHTRSVRHPIALLASPHHRFSARTVASLSRTSAILLPMSETPTNPPSRTPRPHSRPPGIPPPPPPLMTSRYSYPPLPTSRLVENVTTNKKTSKFHRPPSTDLPASGTSTPQLPGSPPSLPVVRGLAPSRALRSRSVFPLPSLVRRVVSFEGATTCRSLPVSMSHDRA